MFVYDKRGMEVMDLTVKEMEVLFKVANRFKTPAEFISHLIGIYDFAH